MQNGKNSKNKGKQPNLSAHPIAISVDTGEPIKEGYRIKDDPILNAIKDLKRMLGTYKGNLLYVSEEGKARFVERRKRFERYMLVAVLFAVLIYTIGVLLPLVSGDFGKALNMFIPSTVLTIVVFFFVLLTYVPSIEDEISQVPKKYLADVFLAKGGKEGKLEESKEIKKQEEGKAKRAKAKAKSKRNDTKRRKLKEIEKQEKQGSPRKKRKRV